MRRSSTAATMFAQCLLLDDNIPQGQGTRKHIQKHSVKRNSLIQKGTDNERQLSGILTHAGCPHAIRCLHYRSRRTSFRFAPLRRSNVQDKGTLRGPSLAAHRRRRLDRPLFLPISRQDMRLQTPLLFGQIRRPPLHLNTLFYLHLLKPLQLRNLDHRLNRFCPQRPYLIILNKQG